MKSIYVAVAAALWTLVACGAVELTDFLEPHPWNPRRWHVNAGTFEDGTWTLDFAAHPHCDLMNSIDIPVSPQRFILDIEADAEAAGTRLTIWTVSGAWVSKDFGVIATASNGARTVKAIGEGEQRRVQFFPISAKRADIDFHCSPSPLTFTCPGRGCRCGTSPQSRPAKSIARKSLTEKIQAVRQVHSRASRVRTRTRMREKPTPTPPISLWSTVCWSSAFIWTGG